MDHLLFVPDIMARYHCSAPTARKLMRQMIHMEKPLAVPEWAVIRWERERMVEPQGKQKTAVKPLRISTTTDYRIPKRRA